MQKIMDGLIVVLELGLVVVLIRLANEEVGIRV